MRRHILQIKYMVIFILMLNACGQTPLYDLAKDGVPVIYAISHDGSTTAKLIVATKYGYSKLYEFTSSPSPFEIAVTGKGRVVVKDSSSVYYTHENESYDGNWVALTAIGAGTINGIAAGEENVYLERNVTLTYYAHYFQKDSFDWSSGVTYVSAGTNFSDIFYSVKNDKTYIFRWVNGGTIYIYEIIDPATVADIGSFTHAYATTLLKGYAWDNTFYAGRSSGEFAIFPVGGATVEVTAIGTPTNTDFAVVDSNNVFCVDNNGVDIEIYRLNSSYTWALEKTIVTAGTPSVICKRYDHENVAIGVSNSTDYDGLYLYNIKSQTMTKLASMQVFAMDIK